MDPGAGEPFSDASGAFGGFIGSGIDLTERREAEEALREGREQLAAARAAGRMGSFDLDLATGRVTRDRNLEQLYGLDPGAASTFEEWARLIHPDDQQRVLDEVARVTAEGGEYHLEHRLVRPDGQVRWLERRGHAYTDDEGRVAGLRGVVIDVTERKLVEAERAVLFERVHRLQQVTSALARAGTPDEVLDTMVGDGTAALWASAGAVALLAPDGTGLELVRAEGSVATLPLADAARAGEPVTGDPMAAAFPLVIEDRVLGAVGLAFDAPQPFDQAQVDFVASVVVQCAQALDRAWSYAAEARARQAAEEAQARLALLADASIVLAGSMEYEATVPEVARLAVPLLGDWCVVDVRAADDGVGDGGETRRVAAVSVDGTEPPVVIDPGAALVEPLETGGRRLGTLALGRHHPDGFTDADRSLATGLATRVAQAVDNALLYRAERRAHQEAETAAARLRFLLDVSTTLASPWEPDERLERLAHQAAAAICDACLIDLLERDGSIRRVAAATSDPALQPHADALRRQLRPRPSDRHPCVAAIRTRRAGLCTEVTDEQLQWIATSDAHLATIRRLDPLSYVAVPLVARGRVLGAITLVTTSSSRRRYGPADVALAEDMARRVALGLDSASVHAEMARVAQTLQAGLLPSVPLEIPGLELGTRYVAAEEGAAVGGDFFDVFALGQDSWAVVVGDVCGRGVEAATVTGLARHTVRSSALEHDSPAAVLTHLNDVLLRVEADSASEADPRFCTVGLARLDVTSRRAAVSLALAGHPRPYILRADGSVRQVGRPGSLLGVVRAPSIADEDHELGPGDALVLYTDGVTERHEAGSFFDDRGLELTLRAAAGRRAQEIAERVEEAARHFVHGQAADDMAVVVVRVPPG